MRTVVVTGGAGFIGSHLVKRLTLEGRRVIVVDDLSWGDAGRIAGLPGVELIQADVATIGDYYDALRDASHIFHLAALISAHESLDVPDRYFQTNVTGLLRVLELCGKLSRPRLVFASTSGVYGNTREPVKREDDPPAPETVYALTKLAGEHLLHMYRERFGYDDVSLRLFNVYGPNQSPEHPYANVACHFTRAAAIRQPVQLVGTGQQSRDFVYVDDVVDAFMIAASRPCAHRVYNVGTGEATSIARLVEIVQESSDAPLDVVRAPAWANDIQAIVADCRRMSTEHGFTARVPLKEGLARTVASFRESTRA